MITRFFLQTRHGWPERSDHVAMTERRFHDYGADRLCKRCGQSVAQVSSLNAKPCTDKDAIETARIKDRDAGLFRAVGNSRLT